MILVTGAAGWLGKLVVRRLLEKGYEVRGTDRVPFGDSPSQFIQADLCDSLKAAELMTGAEAVIHMGAIPGPQNPDPVNQSKIFSNNVQSTYNVVLAAAGRNVPRIVFSSSAFAMGWAWDPAAFVPLYLPLDEEHPMMPFEPYGLSKQVGECIAGMVARSTKTTVASLRFTNVVMPEDQSAFPLPAPTPEDPSTLVVWAYADPRDVADAHVLALEADLCGHEAFLLAQPITRFREPTVELIGKNFGDRVEIRGTLDGNASIISTNKAQRMLGFVPKFRWDEDNE
jgi:nucleoside-diphosphate-sugar epimerase